ncbi:hypothetical protein FB451DRAFT_1569632 [Mycena latifolia]|nr:hypothetical protein FB451DRAFT_1569632 [Mycena latifolia]
MPTVTPIHPRFYTALPRVARIRSNSASRALYTPNTPISFDIRRTEVPRIVERDRPVTVFTVYTGDPAHKDPIPFLSLTCTDRHYCPSPVVIPDSRKAAADHHGVVLATSLAQLPIEGKGEVEASPNPNVNSHPTHAPLALAAPHNPAVHPRPGHHPRHHPNLCIVSAFPDVSMGFHYPCYASSPRTRTASAAAHMPNPPLSLIPMSFHRFSVPFNNLSCPSPRLLG